MRLRPSVQVVTVGRTASSICRTGPLLGSKYRDAGGRRRQRRGRMETVNGERLHFRVQRVFRKPGRRIGPHPLGMSNRSGVPCCNGGCMRPWGVGNFG